MKTALRVQRFLNASNTSAWPPKAAVKADIPDRQLCANTGPEQLQQILEANSWKSVLDFPHGWRLVRKRCTLPARTGKPHRLAKSCS